MRLLDLTRSPLSPVAVEEAVDDSRAAGRRQVERQAFLAERVAWICASSAGQVDVLGVDLVDDDHAVAAGAAAAYSIMRDAIISMPVGALIDDRRRLDRLERRQRLAEEVRRSPACR